MIQHVTFFRLQFSSVVQVPFFFFQLYLGIVLATVVIITGCFSYYQVSVPAFNTLNKIPIYFFTIQVATCKICMWKKFIMVIDACRLHNYTISWLLIFFCWFLELRRPRVLRLWRVSRKWSHRWESDRNFHMIVVRFYLQICAQEALNLRRKR